MKRSWSPFLPDVLMSPPDDGAGGGGGGNGDGDKGGDRGTGDRGAGGGGGGGGGGGRSGALTLTQDELDAMIEDRLARDRRSRQGHQPTADDIAELTRLRDEKRDRERREQEAKGNYEAAIASMRQENEAKEASLKKVHSELLEEIRVDRCQTRLMAKLSTGESKAINPELCARLLSEFVTLDDNRQPIVIGEDKRPRFKGGRGVTIDELVEEFRSKNPWAFEAPNGGGEGAGARGGANNADAGADDLDVEIAEAEKEYEKAHEAAQTSGAALPAIEKSRQARRKLEELKSKKAARAKK